MGHFVEGEDHLRSILLFERFDDYVTEDNPVVAVNHDDAVGTLHGGEGVGDHPCRTAFFEPFQRLLDRRFGLRVER